MTIVIATREFPQTQPGLGMQTGPPFITYWPLFSEEIDLRWICDVSEDSSGKIEFEPRPGKGWPHESFNGRTQNFALSEGTVFVVSHTDAPESSKPVSSTKPRRIRVGADREEPNVNEMSQIRVRQLNRLWRDLSLEQLAEAIAHDPEIRSRMPEVNETPGPSHSPCGILSLGSYVGTFIALE